MPRNSQDDEKSSKDSKSPKNPNSSKKTSDAKKLTISTSGDEDYIPTTPTSSPGNHSNKLCDSFFFLNVILKRVQSRNQKRTEPLLMLESKKII